MAASTDKSFSCDDLEDVRNEDHDNLAAEDKNRFLLRTLIDLLIASFLLKEQLQYYRSCCCCYCC